MRTSRTRTVALIAQTLVAPPSAFQPPHHMRGRGVVAGRASRCRRSTTANRWGSSTLPPYLNLADTCSTAMEIPRIPDSRAAWDSAGVGHLDAGLQGGQLAPQNGRHASRCRPLVVDRRRAGQLDGAVVRGGDPQGGILVADGLPRRGDEGPVVGHAQQHPRVLCQRAEDRIGPHEVQPHRVTLQHELRRHDDGQVTVRARPARPGGRRDGTRRRGATRPRRGWRRPAQ